MIRTDTIHPEETQRAGRIFHILKRSYTEDETALNHRTALDLLVATILSAQCTDKRVNLVTEKLFKEYHSVKDYANADVNHLEMMIKSTGFYHVKARHIVQTCQKLISDFNGIIPSTMKELLTLPGIGRKTANVILSNYFKKTEGIVVDTHVRRVSIRLHFSHQSSPENIERDLMTLFPKKDWITFGNIFVLHGRYICKSRKPLCPGCKIARYCPSRL
ncbi:MAG: endonuclease III [Ignavibacteriales bacterium]|nr:endonuclease III [Ignavibacteriales bacterium]